MDQETLAIVELFRSCARLLRKKALRGQPVQVEVLKRAAVQAEDAASIIERYEREARPTPYA